MAAGKGRKRKRAAMDAPGAESPRRDLAVKKSHVRELAMAGRWQEVKRRYGSKMVAKAKAYAEKQRAKHTPQSLARDILLKNGYIAPSTEAQRGEMAGRTSGTDAPASAAADDREGRSPPTHPRSLGLPRVSVSPEALTEDQLQLIERRRREALERRRRRDALAACAAASSAQQQTRESDSAPACSRQNPNAVEPSMAIGSNCQAVDAASEAAGSYASSATVAAGLTIAGHYIHELDDDSSHIAANTSNHGTQAVEMRAATTVEASRYGGGLVRDTVPDTHHQNAQTPLPVSISQELAAAADIVMWEQEHETFEGSVNQPPISVISASDDDDDADLPRFKLLPSPEEEAFRVPQSNETNQASSSMRTAPAEYGTVQQRYPAAPVLSSSDRKQTRQGVSSFPPVTAGHRPTGSSSHIATSHDARAQQAPTASSRLDQNAAEAGNRDDNAVKTLLETHLLDDALDTALLQFVDMILS